MHADATLPVRTENGIHAAFARWLQQPATAWAVLALSLALTGIGWFIAASAAQQRAREIGGRIGTLRSAARPDFDAAFGDNPTAWLALSGIAVDLLLFCVIASLGAERRRAERLTAEHTGELERSRRELRAVTDTAPDAIVTADGHGALVYANPAAERLFGYPAGAMLGLPLEALRTGSPGQRPVLKLVESEGRRAGTFETTGRRRDGSEVLLEASIARWKNGADDYLTAIARDMTQRKEVERLKDEFVSLVSHEMRTPLTSIAAPLALLAEGSAGELPAPARSLVEMASLNAGRLARLVEEILDAKRMESGRLPLSLGSLDVGEFLRRAVDINQALLDRHGVECCLELPEPALCMRADDPKLMQILTNLLSNAAKFSPPGAQIGLRALRSRGRVRILVMDRGPGIPLEFRPRIFGKFARADDTGQEGVGLGLAISKSLVESMDGSIGYASTVGAGTTFHIELPACTAAQPALAATTAAAAAAFVPEPA